MPCSVTRRPTSWPRPCSGCGRGPTTPSGRSSRTASTTTSSYPGVPTSATMTSSGSRPRCARSWPKTNRSSATSTPSTRASPSLPTSRSSARSSKRSAPVTTRSTLPAEEGRGRPGLDVLELARLHRPVSGAPRPEHQPTGSLRSGAGGGGVLAGRREAPAAPADLRHGLGVGQGPGRAPAPVAPRPSVGTTGSWAPSWTCSPSPRRSVRVWPSSIPRGGPSGDSWRTTRTSATRRPATSSSPPPTSPRPSCSRPRATSTGSPTGCSRPWSSTAASSTT